MPHQQLIDDARICLAGRGEAVDEVDREETGCPGLYALHAAASVWRELGLGSPPDARPLYVGKAENTMTSRDLEGHFGMRARGIQSPTGSSTVRRSLAALLAPAHGYRGIPRNPDKPGHFANFGLSVHHDDRLSKWMRRELRLAVWAHSDVPALDTIETGVLKALLPPLNINKVVTPWRSQVKSARARLAQQAREWEPPH